MYGYSPCPLITDVVYSFALIIEMCIRDRPTTIEAIKAYRPSSNSLSSGQVLHCPYEPQKAKLVVREMTDVLVLRCV